MSISNYYFNSVVKKVTLETLDYDCNKDLFDYMVNIELCNNNTITWKTNFISDFAGGPIVDDQGRYIYSSNLRGIYCLDVKDGSVIWRSNRYARKLLYGQNGISCLGMRSIYRLNDMGLLIEKIKTSKDNATYFIGENSFMIAIRNKWQIIDASNFLCKYVIPKKEVPSDVRFIKKRNETLIVEEWPSSEYEKTGKITNINLMPFKC